MRKIYSFIIALLIVSYVGNVCHAEDKYSGAIQEGKFLGAINGAGATKCSTYLGAVDDNKVDIKNIFFSWAQGYLTSKAIYVSLKDKVASVDIGALSDSEQELILRIYCRKHPADDYVNAVEWLYSELSKHEKEK